MNEIIMSLTKTELLTRYNEVNDVLFECKQILAPYEGREVNDTGSVWRLVQLTKELIKARQVIKNTLLIKYGIFVMD